MGEKIKSAKGVSEVRLALEMGCKCIDALSGQSDSPEQNDTTTIKQGHRRCKIQRCGTCPAGQEMWHLPTSQMDWQVLLQKRKRVN